jgi:hypothetical protein
MDQSLVNQTLNYIAVTSELSRRTLDELQVHQTAREKAASVRDDVLDTLIKIGCFEEGQRAGLEGMLGSHAETLTLLKSAAVKMAKYYEKSAAVAKGTELGQGMAAEKTGSAASPTYDSLSDGYVGKKTSQSKQSDQALLRLIH